MTNNYRMKTVLPLTSVADCITTYYKSIDDILKFFSVCWNGLYEQLEKQKDEDVILLEYDDIRYTFSPRFIIEKIT